MKLKAHYETETYTTREGYYVIKQDSMLGDEPSIVLLTKEQLSALIDDLSEHLGDESWSIAEESE